MTDTDVGSRRRVAFCGWKTCRGRDAGCAVE